MKIKPKKIDMSKPGNGLWTQWFGNGQKKSEGEFKNGVKHGPWKTWYDNGLQRGEGNFTAGQQNGKWTFYWENGQKRSEGRYKAGQQDGRWKFWEKSGRRTPRDFVFKGGEVIKEIKTHQTPDTAVVPPTPAGSASS
ncbi:MAG TPA: hypothetical protein PKW95_16035 [bacterium]|nr:hypothetical protein [bacterium]